MCFLQISMLSSQFLLQLLLQHNSGRVQFGGLAWQSVLSQASLRIFSPTRAANSSGVSLSVLGLSTIE